METEIKLREVKTVKRFYSNLWEEITLLQKLKKTFTVSVTSYTATLKILGDKKSYLYTKDGKKQDFSLVSKIKKEIKDSNLHVDNIRTNMVKYFSLTNLKPCKHLQVYNVDITDCYPTTLRNLGFFSEAFYMELKKEEKIKKLKSIGQIATKKTVYEFVDGKSVRIYQKQNDYLRNVWFTICHETGESIDECKRFTPSFLFFWFDGIYFKNQKDAVIIKEILTRRGYKFKEETLLNFVVKKDKKNLKITYDKDGKQKEFNLPLAEDIYNEKQNTQKENNNFKNE